jgi:hypothetical protein
MRRERMDTFTAEMAIAKEWVIGLILSYIKADLE